MSARRLPHLAQRLFNTPLAILPDKAGLVMAALADRLGIAKLLNAEGAALPLAFADDDGDGPQRGQPGKYKPYQVAEGVAIIPVEGTLVNRLGSLHPYSGMTGYDGIRILFGMAMADSDVRAVMFDFDSPGGEVAGCFDLMDTIYGARGIKPIYAVLNEMAASAAYALASAADIVAVPSTGITGSIGVVAMHADLSRALTLEGVTVTLITYGARKADGSDVERLGYEAYAAIKADVDAMGAMFTQAVARNRNLPPDAVRATEARTFMGVAGVQAGLADVVCAPEEAFSAILQSLA